MRPLVCSTFGEQRTTDFNLEETTMKRFLMVAALAGGFAATGCVTAHAGHGWGGPTPATYGAGYVGVQSPVCAYGRYDVGYQSYGAGYGAGCNSCQSPLPVPVPVAVPVAVPYGYGGGTCNTCATRGYRGSVGYRAPVRRGFGCGW